MLANRGIFCFTVVSNCKKCCLLIISADTFMYELINVHYNFKGFDSAVGKYIELLLQMQATYLGVQKKAEFNSLALSVSMLAAPFLSDT